MVKRSNTQVYQELDVLRTRIELLSALNDNFATLLIALYNRLVEKRVLTSVDDEKILSESRELQKKLQQSKFFVSSYEGNC